MENTSRAKRAQIDARINTIANDAVTGAMDPTEARWEIIELLNHSGYDQMISHRVQANYSLTSQEVEDLALLLRALIEKKALDEKFLDLNRFVTASACGWAYNMSSAGAGSEIRNMRRHTSRNLSVDPLVNTARVDLELAAGKSNEARAYMTASVGGDLADEFAAPSWSDINDIEDEFRSAAAASRSSLEQDNLSRIYLAARALRKVYDLPDLIRPEFPVDREFILTTLATNETAAYDSARAMYDLIEGVQTDEQKATDERMLDLWGDYSVANLRDLLSKSPKVADALARAAASMLARPSRDVLSQALTTIRIPVAGETKFTKALFESWVAVECEAASRFNTKAVDESVEQRRATERLTAALAWPELATKAAGMDGHPYGRTARDVADFIRGVVTDLI